MKESFEEPNPYTRPPIFSFKINLLAVRDWWVNRQQAKRMTEADLYDELETTD